MDGDLEELRRRAYSRDGTPEDLRRLAAAQAPASASEPAPPGEPTTPGPEASAEPVPPEPAPRRRRRPLALAAAAAGLALGIPTGLALAPDPIPPARYAAEDSLRVFDRPAAEVPADAAPLLLPTSSTRAEVRYLGEWADLDVYATREVFESGDAEICLHLVEVAGRSTAACTAETGFRQSGVWLQVGDVAIGWGPHGGDFWAPPPLGAG